MPQRLHAFLTTEAAVLVSAEGHLDSRAGVPVDLHLTGLQCGGEVWARATSRVKTPAESPYSVSLASSIAWSSESKAMTDWTGPNTSWRAIGIPFPTPRSRVGSTKWPPGKTFGVEPPTTISAPSATAASMVAMTLSFCRAEINGPTSGSSKPCPSESPGDVAGNQVDEAVVDWAIDE